MRMYSNFFGLHSLARSSVAFACIDFILNWRLNLFEIVTQSHTNTLTHTHTDTHTQSQTHIHKYTGTDERPAWASPCLHFGSAAVFSDFTFACSFCIAYFHALSLTLSPLSLSLSLP